MNRIRLYWHRLTRRPAVTSPHAVYIRRIPAGAMLDVEDYLIRTLQTLADNPDLMAMLDEIASDRRMSRSHDRWEPDELLVEQLTAALGYELPLYGDTVARLADRLRAVAPAPAVVIPAQREGGAAA